MRCWRISRSGAGNISTRPTTGNGSIRPASERRRIPAPTSNSVCDHTRLEAMRYLLTVPRGEFRLLAEPDSQAAILDAYLRQLPHDETVIEFTGNTTSDLAIAVIAGFNWLTHCAGLAGADRKTFSGTLNRFRRVAMSAQKWWEMEGARERCAQTAAGEAGAAAVSEPGLGGLWPTGERNRRGAQGNVARMERICEIRGSVISGRTFPGCAALHPGYQNYLPLLRVEQRHGGIHHHLDQAGAVMRQAHARARPQARMISSPARRGSPCLRRA